LAESTQLLPRATRPSTLVSSTLRQSLHLKGQFYFTI